MLTRRDLLKSVLLLPAVPFLWGQSARADGVIAATPAALDMADGEIFADFESGTYDGWALEGDCWGKAPATDALFDGQIGGGQGQYFICTLHPRRGTVATGRAVSREFTVTKPFIRFLIGGGSFPGQTCLNLVIDGQVAATATGDDTPNLTRKQWDVTKLMGRKAHLEIVDSTEDTHRGYILVDDIVFADHAAPVVAPRDRRNSAMGSGGAMDSIALSKALQRARDEVATSAPLLTAIAGLNAARLRAGLPPLAADPAVQCLAEVVNADSDARYRTMGQTAPDPTLPARLAQQLYGRSDCQMGGFSSGKMTLGQAAQSILTNRIFADRGNVLSREFQTIGLTVGSMADQHSDDFPEGWYDYITAYGRGTPGPGSVIPLAVEQKGGLPPLIFPVLRGADWQDTFGQKRPDHIHIGEDLMAPKMRPLVACFPGIVGLSLRGVAGNTITVTGEDGWEGIYRHVNCDTPGTRDGQGGARYAFAPGLKSGDRVRAGQFVGYVGDSGNAREVGSHCHFELVPPNGVAVNPTRALKAAPILRTPRPALSLAQQAAADRLLLRAGEIQWDGTVSQLMPGALVMQVQSATEATGKTTRLSVPRTKRVSIPMLGTLPAAFTIGGRITMVGHETGQSLLPRLMLVRL